MMVYAAWNAKTTQLYCSVVRPNRRSAVGTEIAHHGVGEGDRGDGGVGEAVEEAGEAEALLKTVRTNSLNRSQMTMYHLELFETQYRLGRFDQAQAMTEQIEEEFLYPPQRAWLP